MKVELYRTVLCPRCLYASRALREFAARRPEIEIELIEVTTNPEKVRAAGIRTVPTLRIGNDLLSGLILTPRKIRLFIEKHLPDSSPDTLPADR